jgi:hypothetical protein
LRVEGDGDAVSGVHAPTTMAGTGVGWIGAMAGADAGNAA